jgi:hypothetical protein
VGEPPRKALAFNSVAREIRALADEAKWASLVARLPPATRALLAHEVVFDSDEKRTAEVGRRAVVSDLNFVHKMFIRFASPEFVLGRAARLWSSYWRDNGTVSVVRERPGRAQVRYEGLRHATPLFWTVQGGTLRGLAEATGFADVKVTILDGKRSPSNCLVQVEWG